MLDETYVEQCGNTPDVVGRVCLGLATAVTMARFSSHVLNTFVCAHSNAFCAAQYGQSRIG